jgi:hypothetical protein
MAKITPIPLPTFQTFANHSVWVNTPFGLDFYFNLSEKQLQFRNSTGSLINVYIQNGFNANPNFSSVSSKTIVNMANNAQDYISGNMLISFGFASDIEFARIRFGTLDQFLQGKHSEIEVCMTVGLGYNNNFFEVKKLR